ncbi:MAG: alcohol dehydrogenase catalytic domain-containing protein [Phycisphaerales bacterium]
MRAVRFDGRTVAMGEAPAPRADSGEVVIRPTLAALDSIDHGLMAREKPERPFTPGHAFVGVVSDAGGDEAKRRLKGRRVVGAWSLSCGKCELCRGGLSNHCRSRVVVGSPAREGALAEQIALPVAAVHLVPDGVSDEAAAMVHLVAAAAHSAQMLRVEGKPFITILGDGPVGLLTAQVMTRLNASVRLLGKHPEKFELCERWGVKHRHVGEVGRRADQDVVVDCTGSPTGLETAMHLVRPRGKIILMSAGSLLPVGGEATPAAPVTPDLRPIVVGELELLGCRGGSIERGLQLIESGQVDTTTFATRRVRLDQSAAVLSQARRGLVTLVEIEPRGSRPAP